MDKMKPLAPMRPLPPMHMDAWWPPEFGEPSSNGSADSVRYAYFPDKHRLLLERDGVRSLFDTGQYQFRGVLQSSSESALSFLSQHGRIDVDSLTKL